MCLLAVQAAESSSSSKVDSCISSFKASANRFSAVADVGNQKVSTVI